uniref:Uncharacterized protein n=1 Tax=Strigamia maritima TaxID=126957 RepID=T1IWT8_STRMM
MMIKVLTGFALALLLCQYGDALKCIVCNSEVDPACMKGDKLMNAFPMTECKPTDDLCVTKTNVTDGKTIVMRECANLDKDMEGINYETCIEVENIKSCVCMKDEKHKEKENLSCIRWSTPILILCYTTTVFNIKCYKCRSGYDGPCYEPVQNNVNIVDCDLIIPKAFFCKKIIYYNGPGGQPEVIRDCNTQMEVEEGENCFRTNYGDDYCRCKTDACNQSNHKQPTHILFIVTA